MDNEPLTNEEIRRRLIEEVRQGTANIDQQIIKRQEEQNRLDEEMRARQAEDLKNRVGSAFTLKDAKKIINKMKINLSKQKFTIKDLLKGLNVELEHKDVTKGNLNKTAKIALAHLKENPKYYQLLNIMENPKNFDAIMSLKGGCKKCKLKQDYGGGCMTCGGNLDVIKMKPIESFNNQIIDAIKLVDAGKGEPFGSFIFRAQTYPSDIDVIELVEACCKKENVIKKMHKILLDIINRLDKKQGYFYSEVKAGLDHRFDVDLYDPLFKSKMMKLYEQKLLTGDELKSILTLHKYHSVNEEDHDILTEFLRQKYTLRWSKDEIKKGVKKLPGGLNKTLDEALGDKSFIKIDVFAPINDKYVEVTNFFVLVQKDGNKTQFLNIDEFIYLESIGREIKKYSSKTFYKPFKMAKRMWGYARATQNKELLKRLTPLFQSNIARLNQINSEIETLLLIFERVKNPPINFIMNQINNFKSRLAFIYDFDFDEKQVDKTLDELVNRKLKKESIIAKLETLHDEFKRIINENTIKYLNKYNLFPPNEYFYKYVDKKDKYLYGGKGNKAGAEKNPYIKHLKQHGRKVPYVKLSSIPEAPPLIPDAPPLPVVEEIKNIVEELSPKEIKQMHNLIPANINIYCGSYGQPSYEHVELPKRAMDHIKKVEKEISKLPPKEVKKIEKILDKTIEKVEEKKKDIGKITDKFGSDFLNELNRAIEAGRK